MARFLAGSSLSAILVLFAAGLASAQVNPGAPSWTPFDRHSIDTVNLQNLNISLNIPVWSKPGAFPLSVGLTTNFYLSAPYGYLVAPQGAANNWPGSWLLGTVNGMLGEGGAAALATNIAYDQPCPGGGTTDILTGWYLQTSEGTVHPLPAAAQTDSAGCLSGSGFTDQVIDGTGWTVSESANGASSGELVYASNGTIYNRYNFTLTDSNGNAISFTNNSDVFTFTDTLGLAAVTLNYSGSIPIIQWTSPSGGTVSTAQTLTNATLRSAFGCPVSDYASGEASPIVSTVTLGDGTAVGLFYEQTPGYSSDVTGRLAKLTLPTGGSVTYTYPGTSGNHYGLNCTYLVPSSMTRQTSDGTTTYTLAFINNGGSEGETDTVTDAGGNNTVYTFSNVTATPPAAEVLTEVQHNQGVSTLLTTDVYCYNASSGQPGNCATAVVTLPITEVDVYHTINGMTMSSRAQTKYDSYGNVTYSAQYDFGASSPTVATTTRYGSYTGGGIGYGCTAVSSTINNKPCDVITTQNGNTVAESRFVYNSNGNLLTTYEWNGSSWLSNWTANSYNSNGTILTSYDLANNRTTFGYNSSSYISCGSCTNYPFPTSIFKGGLTTYFTWNGIGGKELTEQDASGNTTTYGYASCSSGAADPYWRVMSVTDPLGYEACKTYASESSPDTVSTSFSFNSGTSVLNTTATTDAYGREINVQKQQGPSATTYDTVTTAYNWSGNYRTVATSQPCTQNVGGNCTTVHTNQFDPLGRLYASTSGFSYETLTSTYTENDVLSVLTPRPSGENVKQVQNQYDGLGRLTTSCKIESSASVACGQNTGSASGVVTTTAYTSTAGSRTVDNTRGSQSHSKTVDGLGRMTQSSTPEGGTWNYYYDFDGSCPSGYQGVSGQLAAVTDPNGNLLCYAYDSLNRVTGVNANGTTCRHFYYDNSTGYSGTIPTGVSAPTNPYGRIVEAATDACSSGTLSTDEWFSYDQDGHVTDMWESTPHSGMYYHSVATFAGNGAVATLKFATLTPTVTSTYGFDGEGRPSTLITYNQTVVAGTTFNAASQPLDIDIGTGTDEDVYAYDPNTGRMTNWTFDVGSENEAATLTWNPNGSLKELAITDGFNSGGTQTCYYNQSLASGTGYDDIGRLLGIGCGSTWAQTFSYDQYDNITKAGSISWACSTCYNPSNNQYNSTLGSVSYDSNGNLLKDTFHQYTWNEFSKLKTIDSSGCGASGECVTYDAFGRAVEISNGTAYNQIWYTQLGKTAYFNGGVFSYAYWPTPGGGTVLQTPADIGYLYYFQHKDWLGNARISSNLGTVIIDDRAFAPYGEMYQNFGSNATNELDFTGDTQDIVIGTYDTPKRELNPNQGRWISPDPAGSGWNQYAYATNPNSFVDPTGLVICAPGATNGEDPWCGMNGGAGGGPGAGDDGDGGGPGGFAGLGIGQLSGFASDNPFEIPDFPSGGSIGIPCDFGICGPQLGPEGYTDGPYLEPDEDYGAPYIFLTTVWGWPFPDAANNFGGYDWGVFWNGVLHGVRKPGQSFWQCVNQNANETTGGAVNAVSTQAVAATLAVGGAIGVTATIPGAGGVSTSAYQQVSGSSLPLISMAQQFGSWVALMGGSSLGVAKVAGYVTGGAASGIAASTVALAGGLSGLAIGSAINCR
jgi:RHS repeat-associated protein